MPKPEDGLNGIGENLFILRGERLRGRHSGEHPDNLGADLLVAPASTAEAAAVVAWCGANAVPVVPQGGLTGLVGGSVSRPGDAILSSERLNRIERIDAAARLAVVESGVTLQALQEAAAPFGLTPGIDLASRGSATIGGMISTNAGGILAFRNGVMRHQVLGLEAVLPDGTVFSDMTEVVKTSAGPDMKQLLIGAEGAFGFVTRAVLRLEPVRPHRATALLCVPDAGSALRIVDGLLRCPGAQLEAAELMWRRFFLDSARTHGFDLGWLEGDAAAVLLVDLSAETVERATAELEASLETLWSDAGITSGIVAQSLDQARRFRDLREVSDFIYRLHPDAPSFDVSLPQGALDRYVAALDARLAALGLEAYVYGHIADGNLHVSVFGEGAPDAAMRDPIEDAVYAGIGETGGSFSAEHGVGLEKRRAYLAQGNAARRAMAQALKRTLDPKGIFNRGKVPF
ncbi:FAD-binding oxidoreductase [Rhizobium sp. TRM95111]|uniref:FAD-binding oxidoreductase n=1 Tax=Rhizobium alarense TaxID=2846851 RepID=UPI001F34C418|nr:FAD-binding oxidoreductase [Rhizobium alarense]MCF3642878.1 FAD-binding oxidoreductase [Rhizobium alarense]